MESRRRVSESQAFWPEPINPQASRRHHLQRVGLALFALLLSIALAACGTMGDSSVPTPPPGWTDITPPQTGQAVEYVVSPDTPGLMFATVGGHAQASMDPPPSARLWRSRDGGATWQSLDGVTVHSGTQLVMPLGGHGLVFVWDSVTDVISASADAGETWRSIPGSETTVIPYEREWPWITKSVMVGGRLYTGGFTTGDDASVSGTTRFSVSDDHGRTWRPIEVSVDPAGITLAIAPLDSHGVHWLRLVAPNADFSASATLEQSTDGGKTWAALPSAPASVSPQTPLMSVYLSTNASHMGKVCMALTTAHYSSSGDSSAFRGGAAAMIGPPAPIPQDVSLLASDDGGRTWRGGIALKVRHEYGGMTSDGVRMSGDGSCYLTTTETRGFFPSGHEDGKTILWRLPPGATTVTSALTMTTPQLENLALAPAAAGGAERLIALARTSGPGDGEQISCGQGCTTIYDGGIYRLIAEPAPAG